MPPSNTWQNSDALTIEPHCINVASETQTEVPVIPKLSNILIVELLQIYCLIEQLNPHLQLNPEVGKPKN